MMIDSVVWVQYINVTDTHHIRTVSHVAIANAALHSTHRRRAQNVSNTLNTIYAGIKASYQYRTLTTA